MAFGPEARQFVSGGVDRTLRVWRTRGPEVLSRSAVHAATLHAVAYAPAGTTVASGSDDGAVRCFEVEPFRERWRSEPGDGAVRALLYLPGSERLLAGTSDGTLREHGVADGAVVERRRLPSGVHDLALRGSTLAVACADGRLRLLDREAPDAELRVHAVSEEALLAVALGPDAAFAVVGDAAGAVHVVPLARDVAPVPHPEAHRSAVRGVRLSGNDGRRVLTGGDRRLRTYDLAEPAR